MGEHAIIFAARSVVTAVLALAGQRGFVRHRVYSVWGLSVIDVTKLGGTCRMPGSRPGFTPHFGWGSMAALDGGTLAYLTVREGDDASGRFWEIGVTGHGPRAASLTQDVAGAKHPPTGRKTAG